MSQLFIIVIIQLMYFVLKETDWIYEGMEGTMYIETVSSVFVNLVILLEDT